MSLVNCNMSIMSLLALQYFDKLGPAFEIKFILGHVRLGADCPLDFYKVDY